MQFAEKPEKQEQATPLSFSEKEVEAFLKARVPAWRAWLDRLFIWLMLGGRT
jgi:hypothetical protein